MMWKLRRAALTRTTTTRQLSKVVTGSIQMSKPGSILLSAEEYVAEANDLARTPRFYNSLTTNCTTQIFRMVRALQPGLPLDYRLLLTGCVPDYVYDLGGLDTRVPFQALRDRSHIRGKADSIDPDFSRKIREG